MNPTESRTVQIHARPAKKWNIDRVEKVKDAIPKKSRKTGPNKNKAKYNKKSIVDNIPDIVAQQVVTEVLSLVGDSDWNNPSNVSKTIAKIMSIDLDLSTDQEPVAFNVDRTILVPSKRKADIPFWICQSVIRVDERKGNRYIDYKGSKYNKIDVIRQSKYFKTRLDLVAKSAHCTWNYRYGNSQNSEHKLYQKTRLDGQASWLQKSIEPLLEEDDSEGLNIKDLVLIEFKRKLST